MADQKTTTEAKIAIYPHFTVKNNEKPNRLLAFPFFGLLIKTILLIPVRIWTILLTFALIFFWIGNSFVIFFTGKYWDSAYTFFVKFMRYQTKISLYLYGLIDKYPWFDLTTDGLFELEIDKPDKPSRWLAFPLFGLIVRNILLIPFGIFAQIMKNGSAVALFVSWFVVLIKKEFPESLYEFEHDTIRLSLSQTSYLAGLSDKYPSFHISMSHQTIKIILLILGTIIFVAYSTVQVQNGYNKSYQRAHKNYNYMKNIQVPPNAICSSDTILQSPDFQKNLKDTCSPAYAAIATQAAMNLLGCRSVDEAKAALAQACSVSGFPTDDTMMYQNQQNIPDRRQMQY